MITVTTNDSSKDLTPTLSAIAGVLGVQRQDAGFRIKCLHGEEMVPVIVQRCFSVGAALTSVSLKKPSLDEVFLEFTGRAYREEEGPSQTDMALRMNQFRGRRR